jgi:acyl-CoA reductase-like NAD-dependent aldehyde dehydrogenase
VLNVVPGLGISAGAALASHPDVDLLHFTGSTQTGRQLMQYAGQSNGKPLLLELGGKSPQLVFDDALDLPNLGAVLAQSAFANSGQICVAKTRLLVHENSKEQVIAQIKQHTKTQFQIGNPLDEATTFGPIASQKQRERVEHFLNLGAKEGAIKHSLAVAGERPSRGHFLPPTLFDQVDNRMQIAQAEIFGPVLAVVTFKTDDEAIRLANDVNYGLSASAWTKDLARARRLARELKAGSVTICSTTAQSGSASGLSNEPFGASGFGVVGGARGLAPFTRLKAVQIVTD